MFNLNDRMAGLLEESLEELMAELRAIRRELEQINSRLADQDRARKVRVVPAAAKHDRRRTSA